MWGSITARRSFRGLEHASRLRHCRCRYSTHAPSSSTSSPSALALAGGAAVLTGASMLWWRRVHAQGPSTPEIPNSDANAMTYALSTNDPPGANAQDDDTQYIGMDVVQTHNLAHDCWVVVDGKVFDVTHFHKNHPGGSNIIVSNAGKDVTLVHLIFRAASKLKDILRELFRPVHPPNTLENNLAPEDFKGVINPKEAEKSRLVYQAEQDRVAAARAALPPVESILGLDEMQEAAESVMSVRVIDYYGAGALDNITKKENRAAFHKCRLLPRVMVDVSTIRPQTKIFGFDSALPIYISPASNALLGHPDGELNITRGASKTGILQGVSAAASFSLTQILDEKDKMNAQNKSPMGLAYQVYLQTDRSRAEELVEEAVESGVQALLLTADTNVLGHRQTTEKIKGTKGEAESGVRMEPFTDYPFYHDATQSWKDIEWLKGLAKGTPIYLKGVCHIEDVRKAKELGLAGVILSNHGGRQLDQARTGFDSLRSIYNEDPQLLKDIEVYVDGGVRRGSDVLMALALGARGVGLGRTFLWSQAAYGEQGVVRSIRILESEIVMAMRLLGATTLEEIKPSMVECLQEFWK